MKKLKLVVTVGASTLLLLPGLAQDSSRPVENPAATARREANAAYGAEEYEKCATLFEKAAQLAGKSGVNDYYNAACCYGRSSNLDKAFEMLVRAVEVGYKNVNHMKGDADLESLRDDPRWETLVDKIKVPPIVITENLTTDPKQAPFVYDDVRHFMHAMTLMKNGEDPTTILETEYFGKATPGLKQFVIKYGLTAEAVAAAMRKRPEKYAQLGERLAQIESREASLRESLVEFKKVVPQAVYPPTYYLVSDYGGVASGSPDGQLITVERRTRESIDRMETLLVHELFHFQQLKSTGPAEFYALFGEKKSLLGLTIREGAAEFVAYQVTGRITQQDALDYLLKHEHEIWKRYQPQMMGKETSGWMWSKPDDPNQPRSGFITPSRGCTSG